VADIIAGLHDENGRVTLPGFYDGVIEVPDEVKQMWEKLGFTAESFLGEVGLKYPRGEKDRTALEHIWTRPTAEVNGMWGGYQGAGSKTVIPAEAHAKFTFRLVGDQDPTKVQESFRAYVRSKIPADCTVDFIAKEGSPALRLDFAMPAWKKARRRSRMNGARRPPLPAWAVPSRSSAISSACWAWIPFLSASARMTTRSILRTKNILPHWPRNNGFTSRETATAVGSCGLPADRKQAIAITGGRYAARATERRDEKPARRSNRRLP
jgi:acetylornithine deacetylase/succinyl-diaminopimelate desuccinylase-like protein